MNIPSLNFIQSINQSIEALLCISQNTTAGVSHNSLSDLRFCSKFNDPARIEKSHFYITVLRNLRWKIGGKLNFN